MMTRRQCLGLVGAVLVAPVAGASGVFPMYVHRPGEGAVWIFHCYSIEEVLFHLAKGGRIVPAHPAIESLHAEIAQMRRKRRRP